MARDALRGLLAWAPLRELAAAALLLALTLAFYRDIVFGEEAPATLRLVLHTYPAREYVSRLLADGHLPLWNPYLFGGAPLLADPSLGVLYPLNMLGVFWEAPKAVAYAAVGHAFLGGIFMYALARASLGVGVPAALIGGMAFALGGFAPSRFGQPEVTAAAAWLPLVLLSADQAFRRRNPALLALGGLAMAMQALAGSLHLLYGSMLALFMLGVCHALRQAGQGARALHGRVGLGWKGLARWLAESGWLALVFLGLPALAFGLAAVQLLPTWELWQRSLFSEGQPYQTAAAASLSPRMLLQALLPGYLEYPPAHLIAFVGVLPLGLALLATVRRAREPWTWLLLALAGVGLSMALGRFNPAMAWMFVHLPWLNHFTGPTTWLALYVPAMAGLAALGADVVLRGGRWREAPGRLGWVWHNALWPLLSLAIPAGGLALAILLLSDRLDLPALEVRRLWIALAVIAFDIIYILPMVRLGAWPAAAVALLVAGELFLAGARLPAFTTVPSEALQPAAVGDVLGGGAQPVRILSRVDVALPTASGGPAYAAVKGPDPPRYAEALLPDLPLSYRSASLEGFGRDLLPLGSYHRLISLLGGNGASSGNLGAALGLSGPLLRETMDGSRLDLLAALNVGYILADQRDDIVVQGARFDLSGEVRVSSRKAAVVRRLPELAADALVLLSYLDESAATAPQGSFVGAVTLVGDGGRNATFLLRAGVDTAVGFYPAQPGTVAHQPASALTTDPRRPETNLYITILPLTNVVPLREVRLNNLLDGAALHLRAMTLVDRGSGTNTPVILDDRLSRLERGRLKLYRLEAARGPAFLVHRYEVVTEEGELLKALRERLGEAAFFFQEPPLTQEQRQELAAVRTPAPGDRVEVVSYKPERVEVASSSRAPGFLILTDTYYPGWRAKVNGQETPVLEVDGLFRAVYLPAGEQRVEFRYRPDSFAQGVRVSLYSLGTAAGLVMVRVLWGLRGYPRAGWVLLRRRHGS